MELAKLLKLLIEKQASDLHLISDAPAVIRINGELVFTDIPKLSNKELESLIYQALQGDKREKLEKERELGFCYSLPGVARFRTNIYFQRQTLAASFRLIPNRILGFQELGLPPILKEISRKRRGFILVSGPSGCGKTTTLATLLDMINAVRPGHIITLEDPIEYIHQHKKSIVSQREIGQDSLSFSKALLEATRQDPDVIFIGEMRDLETMATAITAAETGHLVLSTLHTTDVVQTINRIIDAFPPHQQSQIRTQLSITLEAVICQQLVTKKDKKGRVPAVEIMIVTPAIRSLIREAKTFQIYSTVETGRDMGMQTLDQSLGDLIRRGVITLDEALATTHNPEEFRKRLRI